MIEESAQESDATSPTPGSAVLKHGRKRVKVRAAGGPASKLATAPAILTLAASLVLLLLMRGRDVRNQYETDAQAAMIAGDYRKAQVCYERLLQQSPLNQSYRDGLAIATGRL